MDISEFIVKPKKNLKLKDFKTDHNAGFNSKKDAEETLANNISQMAELQGKLYAQDKYSLLIIFQAMDGGGKDSAIQHVMSGLNPQGTQVYSFKQPSKEELDHDYLWRFFKSLPEKGRIGIFNRSYYEDVLVVRVHNLIENQKIPDKFKNEDIWGMRFRQINDFERYLYETGTYVIKFFLHISKEEQKQRFIKRIEDPSKNWKITEEDIIERESWDKYHQCYEDTIMATSTKYAPWYVIPGNKKWVARLIISEAIINALKEVNPDYPKIIKEQKNRLNTIKEKLINEK